MLKDGLKPHRARQDSDAMVTAAENVRRFTQY
jgi:hypothetical protein